MIKFVLVLQICSGVMQTCLAPTKLDNTLYNTWQECGIQGYKSALEMIKQDPINTNKLKTYIRFECNEVVVRNT